MGRWRCFQSHIGYILSINGVVTHAPRGLVLLSLAIATSIDSLAVGLSFAFLKVNILLAVSVVGMTAFLVTILSFIIGRRFSRFAGKRAEAIGGAILVFIGLRILLSHLI